MAHRRPAEPHPTPPPVLVPAVFTTRQREIIYQIAIGLSNKQIGMVLGLSERTIEAHISRIYRRLPPDWRSRAALVRLCSRAGWID
jgi:DNA-binding NarL/FixJ family response regulator